MNEEIISQTLKRFDHVIYLAFFAQLQKDLNEKRLCKHPPLS